MKYTLSMSIVC